MAQSSEVCNQFHKTYFVTIEKEIFAVLTDSFHKPGFKLHVLILQHLFCLVRCWRERMCVGGRLILACGVWVGEIWWLMEL